MELAQVYMNPATGSYGIYDEWYYENEDGQTVNAVDLGEVVPVEWRNGEGWVESHA